MAVLQLAPLNRRHWMVGWIEAGMSKVGWHYAATEARAPHSAIESIDNIVCFILLPGISACCNKK